ncbi:MULTISPECIES: hypothetical protein [Streptomyces]|uniref:hypothetical protein n=1 Tax=Streptomyces TaxID=1883 RepID=UPI0002D873E5|nr:MULTISPECIES: hypothetical protein [Streptomyces]
MPVAEITEITDLDALIEQLDERVTTADSGAENMADTVGICTFLACTAILGICV